MLTLSQFYGDLLKRNVVYRYRPDQLADLKARGLGLPFTPPSRTVETRSGAMIEEVIPSSLDPAVISRAQWQSAQQLCRAWDAFFHIALPLFQADSAAHNGSGRFSLIGSTVERANCGVNPGYPSIPPFVRFDLAERTDGSFAVLDVNSSRPIGAGLAQQLTTMFMNHRLTEAQPTDFIGPLVRTIRACYESWCTTQGQIAEEHPLLAIAIPDSVGAVPDFKILARHLTKTGAFERVVLIEPDDFTMNADGSTLTALVDGQVRTISLVLRTVKVDLDPTIAPALAAAYPNAACIVGPFWRRWLGSKLWLALVQREPFRSEIAEKLGEFAEPFFASLPLCGLYEAGTVTFPDERKRIESLSRTDWVVKVAAGSSARGVLIGRSLSQEMWFNQLLAMADSRLLVQEFIEPRQMAFTIPNEHGEATRGLFLTKPGLYSFNGEAAGFELMACRDSLKIHGGRGTLSVPVFVR